MEGPDCDWTLAHRRQEARSTKCSRSTLYPVAFSPLTSPSLPRILWCVAANSEYSLGIMKVFGTKLKCLGPLAIWSRSIFLYILEAAMGYCRLPRKYARPVLSGEFITPREVVDPLVGKQGLKWVWLGVRACPHQVEVGVWVADLEWGIVYKVSLCPDTAHFMEAMGVEYLTDNLGISLDYFECEMVSEKNGLHRAVPLNLCSNT